MPIRRREAAQGFSGDLHEPLSLLSHALRRKGEAVPTDWVEATEESLRSGSMRAMLTTVDGRVAGLLINTIRGTRCFSHLFLSTAGLPEEDARSLLDGLFQEPPPGTRRIDLTLSAVSGEAEERLRHAIPTWGYPLHTYERERMTLRLDSNAPPDQPPLPSGYRFCRVVKFPVGIIASVDFRAFEASPDRGLVADTLSEDERILNELMRGSLGVFVADGSPGVVSEEGGGEDLMGFILSLELTPGRALIADVAVAPEVRRKGIGYALLHRALRGLLARGVHEATLWVTTANVGARALYERCGFITTQREPIYIWEAPP